MQYKMCCESKNRNAMYKSLKINCGQIIKYISLKSCVVQCFCFVNKNCCFLNSRLNFMCPILKYIEKPQIKLLAKTKIFWTYMWHHNAILMIQFMFVHNFTRNVSIVSLSLSLSVWRRKKTEFCLPFYMKTKHFAKALRPQSVFTKYRLGKMSEMKFTIV